MVQFEEMLGRGIVPLAGTYHAMASAECALGSLNDAVKIVDSMEDAGITSLGRTCTTLLESAERQGRHDISAVVTSSPSRPLHPPLCLFVLSAYLEIRS